MSVRYHGARRSEFLGGPTISVARETPTRVVGPLLSDLVANRQNGRKLAFRECYAGRSRHRELYRVGFPAPGPLYTSFADTMLNMKTALLERVFYHEIGGVFTPPATPDRRSVALNLSAFRSALSRFVTPLTPVAEEDYSSTYYSGQRRAKYDQASAKLRTTGPLRKYSYLDTFLKHEKIPVLKKRAVPRVIQPRKAEYNVALGCYIRPLEHVLYGHIAQVFGRPTVMKGYNSLRTGQIIAEAWSEFSHPMAVGLDASRFDQHVNESLLVWEHSVYDMYFRGDPKLRMLLSWQIRNKGYARAPGVKLKYEVRGGRCSGDMNTALGNCLLMCAMVYGFLANNGLIGKRRTRVALINNGDDCVLIGEKADIERLLGRIEPWFDRFGIVMKVEQPVSCLEQLVFCQTQPVYDGVNWRMCRDPRLCMSKDLYICDRVSAMKHLSTQLHAIGQCGLSLTGGLPVFQEYYSAYIRSGRRGKAVDHNFVESGFYRLALGMREKYRPVTDAARASFARAFGIMPDLQIALEEMYSTLRHADGPFTHDAPMTIPI